MENFFMAVGGFAGLALSIWLQPGPWIAALMIVAGSSAGTAAHFWWERRPGGRKVLPERLKDSATAIQTYRAGSDKHGDRRRWAAAKALQRIAAQNAGQQDRETIAAFARAELEIEVRKRPVSGDYSSADLVHLLAITNPAWQEQFLESLLGTPGDGIIRERLADMRKPPISSADRQYVRDALVRFEELGLKIKPHLDRELIGVRALLDADRWRYTDDVPSELGRKIAPDPLAQLFVALASETDEVCDWEEVGYYRVETEPLRSMRAEVLKNPNFAEDYSFSIFENAAEVWIVNEGRDLEYALEAIVGLSGGAVSLAPGNDPCAGEVKIASDGTVLTCLIDGGKRPDLTPLYDILSQAALKHGYQYVFPSPGSSSDTELIAYIALSKLDAFAAFTKPLDWPESHN